MSSTKPSPSQLHIQHFYDEDTSTLSYVVTDAVSRQAAIIDSVLDYDAASGTTATDSADALIAYVRENGCQVQWILETHAHADHLSAAPYIQQQLGGTVAIGKHIDQVQSAFQKLFNLEPAFQPDGSQFGRLLDDGCRLPLGELFFDVLHTPGHTPACVSYVIADAQGKKHAFIGDTLFMPDFGSARCDFPGGDAAQLYSSIQRLYALPDDTLLYMCHDYQPDGRPMQFLSSVAEQKKHNIHLRAETTEAEFVALRTGRDAGLKAPRLLLPSVQVNIRAGYLPPAEDNGVRYLKIPLNALGV